MRRTRVCPKYCANNCFPFEISAKDGDRSLSGLFFCGILVKSKIKLLGRLVCNSSAYTGFLSQGRAELRDFREAIVRKSTQLSPSLSRKPGTCYVVQARFVTTSTTYLLIKKSNDVWLVVTLSIYVEVTYCIWTHSSAKTISIGICHNIISCLFKGR